jgi:hypothetical protein
VLPGFKGIFTPGDTTVCGGDTVTFVNSTTGTSSFYWYVNGGFINSEADLNFPFTEPSDHTVRLVSGNGICQDTTLATIAVRTPSIELVDVNCSAWNNCTGNITVSANGGDPPYIFQWNDSTSQTGGIADSLCSGFYLVEMTDANGCTDTAGFEVCTFMGTINEALAAAATIFPNPNSGRFTLEIKGLEGLWAEIEIMNALGQVVFQQKTILYASVSEIMDFSQFPTGNYLLNIHTHDGSISREIIIQ